jgi:hypothetical protein
LVDITHYWPFRQRSQSWHGSSYLLKFFSRAMLSQGN